MRSCFFLGSVVMRRDALDVNGGEWGFGAVEHAPLPIEPRRAQMCERAGELLVVERLDRPQSCRSRLTVCGEWGFGAVEHAPLPIEPRRAQMCERAGELLVVERLDRPQSCRSRLTDY